MSTVGERIRIARKALGITQPKLAAMVGLEAPSHVAAIERDQKRPSKVLLRAIAKALNVSEEWLITGEGPMHVPVTETIAEAIRFYPRREKIEGLLKALEAEAANAGDLQLREAIAEYKSSKVYELEDLELQQMLSWLAETYKKGDARIRNWLAVQFERAFPDFKEDLLKKQGKSGDRPEAAAAGDIS